MIVIAATNFPKLLKLLQHHQRCPVVCVLSFSVTKRLLFRRATLSVLCRQDQILVRPLHILEE